KLLSDKNDKNDLSIMDVGANFGYLSLVWASTIAKEGEIHAFEPNKRVFESLHQSIEENELNNTIHLHNFAVGQKDGVVNLYTSSTTSNILDDSDRTDSKSSIKMISLDSFMQKNFLQKCDLIKIDVDGIEYEILKGAEKLIEKFKP